MTDRETIQNLEGLKIAVPALTEVVDNAISALEERDKWERVKQERDAAVADLYHMGGCPNCTHNKGRNPHTGVYMCKKHMEFPNGDCFKWRGVKEG